MQGRFKRDGSAAAEQEPRGTDRGSSPQHAQRAQHAGNTAPAAGDGGDRAVRTGVKGGGEQATPARAKEPTSTGSRIALRNWRISTRLVSLLALPVVAATTLGGLRINESMNDMEQLEHMQLLTDMTKQATELALALQEERDKSAGPLANGTSPADFKVKGPREKTDRAKNAFIAGTQNIDPGDDESLLSIRSSLYQIASRLNSIRQIREGAYAKKTTNSQTVNNYSQLINSLLSLSQDMAQATSNPEMIKRTRALSAFSSAKEYASIQRAIIAASLPANNREPGKLTENDRLYARSAMESEDAALKSFDQVYVGDNEDLTATLETGSPTIDAADKYAHRVLSTPGRLKSEPERSYMDWTDASTTKINAMKRIEATLLNEMEQKARELRNESQQDAILNGVLILLVLGVSLVGAFVVARSMIRSLRRLQDTATRVAQDRLPELVKQLSEADPQDVDTSVESVGVHSRDEIGQVAAAFDDVHREAVRLAAEQALLRGNVNAMFTNLSRRSQGLIQRQLSLISELESREADPDQLSSLFKLDHLATRMRRNGENLLVLAGEEPGRRWTRPVPLVDVLRAAASEVEQYERIELSSVPGTEVAGRVVNDLVHLLAELLENATSFSSPQTKVRVTGHALPDGRVLVEIHDTGIGLSPEDLAAINERLASPPTVDVSVSRRMGLFVVGRLSLRHGIRIQLRPSDSGGTTALVMLPVDVAQGGKKAPAKTGAAAQPQVPSGPGARQAAGPGAVGAGPAPAGRLPAGSGGARGQVSGSGQRAALPGRDGGPAQGHGQQPGSGQGGGPGGAFGGGGGRQGGNRERSDVRPNAFQQNGPAQGDQGRPQQQPPRGGGARAELPGSHGAAQRPARPQTTSWGNDLPRGHEEADTASPQQGLGSTAEFQRPDLDAPASTGVFERSDVRGPVGPAATGQYERPGQRGPQGNAPQGNGSTGQYQRPELPGPLDPASTAQLPRPDFNAPQQANPAGAYGGPGQSQDQGQGHARRPGQSRPQAGQAQGGPQALPPAPRRHGRDNGRSTRPPENTAAPAPRQPAAHLPPQPQHELPPAPGGGDGRTPLFDTLESNWFQQQAGEQQSPAAAQQPHQQSGRPAQQSPAAPAATPPMPQRAQARDTGAASSTTNGTNATNGAAWRTSPNDELVRQAERVKKPAAGGVTTSGLPRRVPRANLVPGTAQQQNHQTGPQVSRAPDDVRGRLTNLRRGIQQGRQAGNNGSATGSFNIDPTHQQER
ncbi:nitrate- and nitrite sensing domain-containing protein [Streptomyces sp. ISL-96]|uniref:sensor histidine kinase n=1 Tax=Streptomyces sp. ISL-96 TaxID=2819191 RepID=UPI001BE5FC38|nr:nitrate- and nitrite sensing domain-containing protein [Streptomyces sp. ISL-96]MBT2487534.1 nitrate- and nitrite sensing domain-containing protein [Streptomyces sp. ISL-96]